MPNPLVAIGVLGVASTVGSAVAGEKGAKAAKKGAEIQAQAGLAAIEEAKQARETARADLQPYTQFGLTNLPALQGILSPTGQVDFLQNNPIFQASLKNLNDITLNNAAVRGRLAAGDTKQSFVNNWTAAALPILQNQQNALFNAVNLGQSSAAGQGNTALTTGQLVGNTLTDIGAARAGGIMGAANARSAAIGQGIRGITSLVGGFV